MLYASGGATSGCIPAIPILLYNSVVKETSIPIYTVYIIMIIITTIVLLLLLIIIIIINNNNI